MKKNIRRESVEHRWAMHGGWGGCVENDKRRRALPPLSNFAESKFFDRLLSVKRVREFVFIPKAVGRGR